MFPPTTAAAVKTESGVIGIVGGVGPLAGLDLQAKIIRQTIAGRDQEHLPVLSLSWPGPIADRTEYLLGRVAANPAHALLAQLRLLAAAGATVASLGAVTSGTTYSFPVTPVITGDGAVSFRLTSTSSDGARYVSKEDGGPQQPRLVVTCA